MIDCQAPEARPLLSFIINRSTIQGQMTPRGISSHGFDSSDRRGKWSEIPQRVKLEVWIVYPLLSRNVVKY
jgi:hypothetical protein